MELWEETSVPQSFLILASCCFMFNVKVAEACKAMGVFFLAWTVSSERFLQENATVVCDDRLH